MRIILGAVSLGRSQFAMTLMFNVVVVCVYDSLQLGGPDKPCLYRFQRYSAPSIAGAPPQARHVGRLAAFPMKETTFYII